MKIGLVLVNYKDYAERFLAPCLASIRALDPALKPDIFIVDNASTPATAGFLAIEAPEARLIINQNNDGFAKGNNDAMRVMLEEGYEYILLLNMDASLAPDALLEMVHKLETSGKAGAAQARIMLDPDKELVNSVGNATHFLGFGYCLGYRQPYGGKAKEKIAYPSGACVLLRASALKAAGLFDEEFWMYNEDQDLGWRLWLSGWECLLAEKAVAYHHYEFSRSQSKYFWMERNRLIAAWKNYSCLALILAFPALITMELGMSFFSIRSGWFAEKRRAWAYFFNPKNWGYLYRARKQAQSLRQRPDHDILELFTGRIWYQEIDHPLLRYVANPIFSAYFVLLKAILRLASK
ncbi:MAG: glycosyltransferase family 2 protein [Bacillota bacterium]